MTMAKQELSDVVSASEPTKMAQGAQSRVHKSKWKWAAGLAAIVLLIGGRKHLPIQTWLGQSLDWVEHLGSWGPLLFMAFYSLAAVLLVPGSVLTLGAGALFGVVRGSIYVSVASTLGATGAFLIGRYLARDRVAARIAGHPTFSAMDKAVAEEGWKIVGLTRLSPVFPFTLLNYAFGLTRVRLRDYVVASWLGMMPGTVMYVYLGSLAKAGAAPRTRTQAEWALYGAGLLATVAVTITITRSAKSALAKKISA